MIINVPTYETLNEIALRLYFSAWFNVIWIKPDFKRIYDSGSDPNEDWKQEWEEYIEACQPEFQSACALVQQSNELALKARICQVSPYLLILRTDTKFSTTPKDVDFAEFRTLDAVELPAAVNSICSSELSDKFIQSYNEIRSLRNRIAHIGDAGRLFTPEELLHLMVQEYHELWKDRSWLHDRLEFASRTRSGVLHDNKYTSAHMEIMHEWSTVRAFLTKSEYKKLFGIEKSKRLYLCFECFENADTRYADLDVSKSKTGFLNSNGSSIECLMCRNTHAVDRVLCKFCKGNVLGVAGSDYFGRCHSCGEYQLEE